MKSFEKLLLENKAWAAERIEEDPEFFHRLENIQRPEFLWIGCSDSRVPANEITGTQPGEIFVHRNIANLVVHTDLNLLSVLEYAVHVLEVKHIIVCGHSQCGAMKALLDGKVPDDMLGLKTWFQHAEATRKIMQIKHKQKEGLERVRAATEENVLVQLNHLSTHPCVAAGISAGTLHVYGWYYDIGTGVIKQFDQSCSAFTDLEDVAIATSPMPVRHS